MSPRPCQSSRMKNFPRVLGYPRWTATSRSSFSIRMPAALAREQNSKSSPVSIASLNPCRLLNVSARNMRWPPFICVLGPHRIGSNHARSIQPPLARMAYHDPQISSESPQSQLQNLSRARSVHSGVSTTSASRNSSTLPRAAAAPAFRTAPTRPRANSTNCTPARTAMSTLLSVETLSTTMIS